MTVNATQAEWDEVVRAARQLNGVVSPGQVNAEGTLQAILPGIQNLTNLLNQKASSLAKNITDGTTAVTTFIAAQPTAHLSDEEQAAVAAKIAEAVHDLGVTVDSAALSEAIATDLGGRLAA